MRKWLHMGLAAILASCAYGPAATPTSTIDNLGALPTLDRNSMPETSADELRSSALDYYAQGDYVRALRYGYWAAQTIPTDVRLRLLLGIVYDGGFDRPDLALPEYQRALSLKPDRRFHQTLKRRIHYLNRRLLQDATRTSLIDNSTKPLSENWLAVYPLQISGPREPAPGLEIGLLDWILPDVKARSMNLHVDAFTSWIVAQVFREVSNDPSPAAFARWCGAGVVLTGQLTDLGDDRLRVVIELLSPSGTTAYASAPFVISAMAPDSAFARLLDETATALALLDAPEGIRSPITNPASLALYTQGFARYLVGQVADAEANIRDAVTLDSGSSFLDLRLEWAESDLLGGHEGGQLLDDYHRLLKLPDPDRLVRERLMRGHRLGSPAISGLSGREVENPYKPPRPERSAP